MKKGPTSMRLALSVSCTESSCVHRRRHAQRLLHLHGPLTPHRRKWAHSHLGSRLLKEHLPTKLHARKYHHLEIPRKNRFP